MPTNAHSSKTNNNRNQAAKDDPKEKTSPASKRHKLNKSYKHTTWDSRAKLAIAKGIIDPSKSFMDKNGKQVLPGKVVVCEACD